MVESAPAQPAAAGLSGDTKPDTAAAESKPEKPATDDLSQRERIVLFTAGGPLLVDVWVTMEGQPHNQIFSERVQKVLDAADTNKDQKSTWRELAANEEFLKAERALNPNYAEGRTKAWLERYDLNRDKHIQPAGGRGLARSRRGPQRRPARAPQPPLVPRYSRDLLACLAALDADNNRRLGADEMDAAPDKFLLLDANDDRIITTPELAPLREQLHEAGRQMPTAGNYETRHAALDICIARPMRINSNTCSPISIRRAAPSARAVFPHCRDCLTSSMQTATMQLYQDELAGLLTIAPHLQLAIAFDQARGR